MNNCQCAACKMRRILEDKAHKKYINELQFTRDKENIGISFLDNFLKQKLTEYTNFLLKEGYCDTDVYSEGNSAIDKFLNPKLK